MISIRSVLTEPKAVLVGVMAEIFSARFVASTAAFNAEMAASRPLGCLDSASIV